MVFSRTTMALVFSLIASTPGGAATIVVDTTDDVSASACTLRDAITNANGDDQSGSVACAAGAGADSIVLDGISGVIQLGSSLPDIETDMTLTGPGAASLAIDAAAGLFGIVTLREAVEVTLSKLTLRNADTCGSTPDCDDGTGTVKSGGAVEMLGAELLVEDCVFANNTAYEGGAIATTNFGNNTLTIVRSEFRDNTSAGFEGGALSIDSCGGTDILEIRDSVFADNGAYGDAGAISLDCSPIEATIIRSTFVGNRVLNNAGDGGVIEVDTSSVVLSIEDSTFSGNEAAPEVGDGGAIYVDDGGVGSSIRITNTTFSGNTAGLISGEGGAITTEDNEPDITMVLANVTITGNSAGALGGGLALQPLSGSTTLTNTLVAGNWVGPMTAATPNDIDGGDNVASGSTNNLIGDSATAAGLTDGVDGNIVGNTGVGTLPISSVLDLTLADNGGLTQTHALVPLSPAIDAGRITGCLDASGAVLATDQRGLLRPAPAGSRCDIGAYELQEEATLSSSRGAITALASNPGFSPTAARQLSAAVRLCGTALEKSQRTPPNNVAALWRIRGAMTRLYRAVDAGVPIADVQPILESLVNISRQTAADAIAEAQAQGGKANLIAQAQAALAAGDAIPGPDDLDDAVREYKVALRKATRATP